MKVMIKKGTSCFQDFSFFKWPNLPYNQKTQENMIFEASLNNGTYSLVADGFGKKDNYGNGCILIKEEYAKNNLIKVD